MGGKIGGKAIKMLKNAYKTRAVSSPPRAIDTMFQRLGNKWKPAVSSGKSNRYRNTTQNLRTTFKKIVRRAGLSMFPRPFDSMRMTRSNEVYRRWGAFLESQWIGHSRRVREDNYLSMTDDDFKKAAEWTNQTDSDSESKKTVGRNKNLPPNFPPAQDGIGLHGVESVQRISIR